MGQECAVREFVVGGEAGGREFVAAVPGMAC